MTHPIPPHLAFCTHGQNQKAKQGTWWTCNSLRRAVALLRSNLAHPGKQGSKDQQMIVPG